MEHKIENIEDTWHGSAVDSVSLMKQLAKMANIEACGLRRMVLVLDVNCCPMLYTEAFLDKKNSDVELVPTELKVEEKAVAVDTTTMQNETWRTKEPLL